MKLSENAQVSLFPDLQPDAATGGSSSFDVMGDVEVEISVQLGQTRQNLRDILTYSPGSILELDRLAGEAVDVLVNGRLVARGEVVVLAEKFGVRITDMVHGGAKRR